MLSLVVFFFKQKTAYEMRISDWSSDVCASDLLSRTCGNRASMGKVVEVTAQGYEQRASAPAAAKCRTLTRRFAPPSPASRRGAGTVRAPTNAQEQASASFEDR